MGGRIKTFYWYKGKDRSVTQIADMLGYSRQVLWARIRKHGFDKAVTMPPPDQGIKLIKVQKKRTPEEIFSDYDENMDKIIKLKEEAYY